MSHHQGKLPGLGYKPTPKALQLKNNPSHTIGLREQQFPPKMVGKHNSSYPMSLHAPRSRAWGSVHGEETLWPHNGDDICFFSWKGKKKKAIRKPETTKSIPGAKYEANTVRHDFEQLAECKKRDCGKRERDRDRERLHLTLTFQTANTPLHVAEGLFQLELSCDLVLQ